MIVELRGAAARANRTRTEGDQMDGDHNSYQCLRGKLAAVAPAEPPSNPHLWILVQANGEQWFATINVRSDKDPPAEPVGLERPLRRVSRRRSRDQLEFGPRLTPIESAFSPLVEVPGFRWFHVCQGEIEMSSCLAK